MSYNKDSWTVVLRGGFNEGFDVEIKGGEESEEDGSKRFSERRKFPVEVMISSSKLKVVSRGMRYREVD